MFSKTSLASALLLSTTATAFQQSSPFFLLSSTSLAADSGLRSTQLASAAHVTSGLTAALSACDAELYLIVEQPGLSAEDFNGGNSMPRMRRRMMEGAGVYESAVQIPEVIGAVGGEDVVSGLEGCGRRIGWEEYYKNGHVDSDKPIITTLSLEALHPEVHARQAGLEAADAEIENILSTKAAHIKHVLIFLSSPPSSSSQHRVTEVEESQTYEMDAPILREVLHSDLKRDTGVWPRASNHSSSDEEHQAGLPLFERYSFLSPAIFMGLTVTILLISILYVGLSAISGLEVSYLAFSKEMGPAAQQKASSKLQ